MTETFLGTSAESLVSRGGGVVIALASRSKLAQKGRAKMGKPASGLRARRGSSPFPGATSLCTNFSDNPQTFAVYG